MALWRFIYLLCKREYFGIGNSYRIYIKKRKNHKKNINTKTENALILQIHSLLSRLNLHCWRNYSLFRYHREVHQRTLCCWWPCFNVFTLHNVLFSTCLSNLLQLGLQFEFSAPKMEKYLRDPTRQNNRGN
jgi:hypothetical protein